MLPAEATPRPAREITRLLKDEEAFASSLLVALLDNFGTQALQWDPETIRRELEDAYGDIPRFNFDKVMAAVTLLTTDQFYKRLPAFNDLCNVLAGDDFTPAQFDPATVAEMAWGMTEAMMLSPPDEGDPFSEPIRGYIGKQLKNEGFSKAPDILQVALDGDSTELVRGNFENDPEMFQAVYESQQEEFQDVINIIRGRMQRLAEQLQALPLQHGDSAQIVRSLQGQSA